MQALRGLGPPSRERPCGHRARRMRRQRGTFWCVTRPCRPDVGHSRDGIWHVLQVVAEEDMPRSVFHDFPSAAGPAPAPRWGHATAAVGDCMYVFGGVGASVFDDAFCYDAGGRPRLVSCRALLVLVAHRLVHVRWQRPSKWLCTGASAPLQGAAPPLCLPTSLRHAMAVP